MTEKELAVESLRKARGWRLVTRQMGLKHREGKEWLETKEKLLARLGTGFLAALVGGRGSGKTQIAADLMWQTADSMKRAEYTTATGFFLAIKSTYGREATETEESVVSGFCRPGLLVIDEYEKRNENEWQNNLLFEVINRRYGMMRDTLLISNLTVQEFGALLGPSLSSRMSETGGIIECVWDSFRK